MENLDEFNGGVSLIVDFFKENKRGIFTTMNLNGQKIESDVTARFIYKKPLPSIEVQFDKESDFYLYHRKNLYRGSIPSRKKGQLFKLSVGGHKNGVAIISGVAQIMGNRVSVIVHLVEYISGKSGRKFDYPFFERIDD